jgi:integrase
MKLTAKSIRGLTLPPKKHDAVWFDDDVPGFGVRLRAGGSRTFILQYRLGNKQHRMVIGSANAPEINLAQVRRTASQLHGRIKLGQDPQSDKATAKAQAENTFGFLVQQYLRARQKDWRPRSAAEVERHLVKRSRSLHPSSIVVITQRDISTLLNNVAAQSGDVAANRVRTSLAAFFSWLIREGIKLPEGNVVANTNQRAERPRDRILSDGELARVWDACHDDDYGRIIRLLVLTGQRLNEIAALRWSEVYDEQIVLPADRTKNGRSHIIPLSETSNSILRGVVRGARTFVFGATDTGFHNFSIAKRQLDERLGVMPHWTAHDLRRTAATRMADLGVQPHIIEAVLNHVSGHKAGVAGIYNRAAYDKEKREALNLWAEHLMATIEGRAATVVPLKRA